MPALDPASPVPLYVQLAESLLGQIRAGALAPGQRIPSEHELAGRYGVGRPTVRQATGTLVRRGFVRRRRGAGTFVREPSAHVDLFSLGGTLASFAEQGLELQTDWVAPPEATVAPGELAVLGGREVFAMARRGCIGGEPVLVERIWMDARSFPDLDQHAPAGCSLSELVRTRYRLEPTAADQRFRVDLVGRALARWLGLEPGSPVLQVDRTLHFPGVGEAVVVRMDCRTDRFSFSQRIGADHG